MKLVNEGKLHLEDTVRSLLPQLWFENPWEATDPVRLVDLLEHTTGWDDIHFREYAKDAPDMGLVEALDYDHHSRVSRWRPGTRWSYCNAGPAVAALIVEKISGQRFEDYVQQHFFGPIGMRGATFMPAPAARSATLYHGDGVTPFAYSHILFRPAGALNASAEDMAAYLAFYLQRGQVNGAALMAPESIARIETPTRSLGARQGLQFGYGLYNYGMVDDGLVYHGHDGAIDGALSTFAYMPEQGVGYFFSINAGSGQAFDAIRRLLRGFVGAGIRKPPPPAPLPLPADAASFAGWYEPVSPREEQMHFIERLMGLFHFDVVSDKVVLTTVTGQQMALVGAGGHTLRQLAAPVATVALIAPDQDGSFVVVEGGTMRRMPTVLAYAQMAMLAWLALALLPGSTRNVCSSRACAFSPLSPSNRSSASCKV